MRNSPTVNQLGGEGFAGPTGSVSRNSASDWSKRCGVGTCGFSRNSSMELGIDVGEIDQVFR